MCISVVRDTAKYIGMAVANLATMLDPEAVVLGGIDCVVRRHDARGDPARMQPPAAPAQAERVRIVLSTLGADAVAIGAARRGPPAA